VFRWTRIKHHWRGIVEGSVIIIRQKEKDLIISEPPTNIDATFLRNYFRLGDNLPEILSRIKKDAIIAKAIDELYGLRLIRQDPWECLISFICATYANIPRIKSMIANLSQKFGNKITSKEGIFYSFPNQETLAKATIRELRECGLGFRAKYVFETTQQIVDGFNLQELSKLTYEKARNRLLSLPGVGSKVADCILLFSMDKLEAFPVDVWISRIISKYYSRLKFSMVHSAKYQQIRNFGRAYFGVNAGYAQEYLYHFYRQNIMK
jgi:N-glycosylase/DNA lyase